MQHSAGCMYFSWAPILKLLGLIMVVCGVIMSLFVSFTKSITVFIETLVRLVAIILSMIIAYRLHGFEVIDPTMLSDHNMFIGIVLMAFAVLAVIAIQHASVMASR